MSNSLLASDLLDWSYAHKILSHLEMNSLPRYHGKRAGKSKGFLGDNRAIYYAICPALKVQGRGLLYLLLSVILHGLQHFITWDRLQPDLLGCGREELSVLIWLKVWYVCVIVPWQFPIGTYFNSAFLHVFVAGRQWLLF